MVQRRGLRVGSDISNRVWGRTGVLTERRGGEGMVQDRGLTVGVIHTPYRVWGRAGVLTERRGGGGGGEGMVQERGLRVGVVHLTGCGVGLGFSQKEGEEDEGWSRREG